MSKPKSAGVLYYDHGGDYWIELRPGEFRCLGPKDAKLHLRVAGLSKTNYIGALNELEQAFYTAQLERSLDYSGSLAGHRVGPFCTPDGRRVLVTSHANIIPAVEGEFQDLHNFLQRLLGYAQLEAFFGWLKFARRAMERGDFRPGQFLVFAGSSGCGKSLCQAIIGEWLGGRTAKPWRYMIGDTAFNGDLAGAEHWCIEDENSSTDIRQRRRFGSSIKDAVVNKELSIHAKGRQAITLPTFRRLTLSVNDEPENLAILPPLDASLADKITMFRCHYAEVGDDRLATWKMVTTQLPALAFEIERWKVPKAMADSRYGVRAYHDAHLLDSLMSLSPEERLRTLIEIVLFEKDKQPFIGTTEQLEKQLRSSEFAFSVDKLLNYSSACSVYLARLASRLPKQYSFVKKPTKTVWTILAPEGET